MKVKIDIIGSNKKEESQKIETTNINEEGDNTNTEQLYKRYNECRDYQLKQFWENSKFVWAFLLVCFAAYGALFMSKDINCISKQHLRHAMLFVSSLGIALSFVWLWMARASKAWFEVFENVIWHIEDVQNKLEQNSDLLIHNFWSIKREKFWKGFFKNIFMAKPFSPSKMVIGIGWNLIIIWIGITIFSFSYPNNDDDTNHLIDFLSLFPIIGTFLMRIICVRSSTLRNLNEEKVYQNLKKDFSKLDIYFEIKGRKINFYLTDNKAVEQLQSLVSILKIKPTLEELKATFSYSKVKKHYKLINQKIDIIKKLLDQNNGNSDNQIVRVIIRVGNSINVKTSNTDKDYELILKHLKDNIQQEGNKIIIPLECINNQ